MGAYSPAPVVTPLVQKRDRWRASSPRPSPPWRRRAGPSRACSIAGLMLTATGPKLLEFNVRFGDPECQALCLRLMSDLLPALVAARDGELEHFDLRWHAEASLCVVMAAKGYPGATPRAARSAASSAASEVEGRERSSTPAPRADGRPLLADRRPGAGRHRARRDRSREAQERAYAASTSSTGRRASAAATSAGARCVRR